MNSPHIETFHRVDIETFPFFKIEKGISPLSSILHIDLGAYITSFYEENLQLLHESLSANLIEQISGINGDLLWKEVLDTALSNNARGANIATITASPACQFLSESFIELVKNVMDEGLLSETSHLQLQFSIDISQKDTIGMRVEDNGPGFSREFLLNTQSLLAQKAYLRKKGSDKHPSNSSDEELEEAILPPSPRLFGGTGRGLRNLIARVTFDDSLMGKDKYATWCKKPIVSEISFSNRFGMPGAIIDIKTSLTPLQKLRPEYFFSAAALPSDDETPEFDMVMPFCND